MDNEQSKKRRHKAYMKLNIMTLFFIGVSFISITLAWFAYSGLITARTEINVKAWNIEFNKNGDPVSNELIIRTSIEPGMETMTEVIDIKNLGDTAAAVTYEIEEARILNDELSNEDQNKLKDTLSHNYPFHVDMSISDNFIRAHDGTGKFQISVSWPFDSGNDEWDSEWGNKAYDFALEESKKEVADQRYAIKLEIHLKAVQYIDEDDAIDHRFRTGNIVLYDVEKNKECSKIEGSCIKTYVIDRDNRVSDSSVHLLPELFDTYKSGAYNQIEEKINELKETWTVTTKPLSVEQILPIISNNIDSSIIMRPKLSNEAIGYLNYIGTVEYPVNSGITYEGRIASQINKVTTSQGSFRFTNSEYPYFSTAKCYWLNNTYNEGKHFALKRIDDTYSKIYGQDINDENGNTQECSIVPVIEVSKANLK